MPMPPLLCGGMQEQQHAHYINSLANRTNGTTGAPNGPPSFGLVQANATIAPGMPPSGFTNPVGNRLACFAEGLQSNGLHSSQTPMFSYPADGVQPPVVAQVAEEESVPAGKQKQLCVVRIRKQWKKYGEKVLKPKRRGDDQVHKFYYRCNFPGCPVKKQIEHVASAAGKMTKRVASKGLHTHPKDAFPDGLNEVCWDEKSDAEGDSSNTVASSSTDDLAPSPEDHVGRRRNHWKKYGHKVLKTKRGSDERVERCYYRCNFPDCPAKKLIEKRVDAEGKVHKKVDASGGPHTHPKEAFPTGLNEICWDEKVAGDEDITDDDLDQDAPADSEGQKRCQFALQSFTNAISRLNTVKEGRAVMALASLTGSPGQTGENRSGQ